MLRSVSDDTNVESLHQQVQDTKTQIALTNFSESTHFIFGTNNQRIGNVLHQVCFCFVFLYVLLSSPRPGMIKVLVW